MTKSKPIESRPAETRDNSTPVATDLNASIASTHSMFDHRAVRGFVSLVLMGYLLVLVLGPLSNPVGSEFLTRPMARFVSPVHRALFLGHGYRFFGPDPGPGHLVVYRITDHSGNSMERQFPERDTIWPRLMYHRWFMLSETVFQEHALTPDEASFRDTDTELEQQIQALRFNGRHSLSQRLEQERKTLTRQYQNTRKRIDGLVKALAGHLLKRNDGQQIELFVQERNVPFAIQILTGDKLADEKFLSPLNKIGEFRRGENGEAVSLEFKPVPVEAKQEKAGDE
jgi:hypothetical protein